MVFMKINSLIAFQILFKSNYPYLEGNKRKYWNIKICKHIIALLIINFYNRFCNTFPSLSLYAKIFNIVWQLAIQSHIYIAFVRCKRLIIFHFSSWLHIQILCITRWNIHNTHKKNVKIDKKFNLLIVTVHISFTCSKYTTLHYEYECNSYET